MKKALILSLLAGITASALAQQAQTAPQSSPAMSPAAKEAINVARYKQALSDGRRQLFAVGMSDLTPQQLETFWAVYGDYEKEKNAITSARVDLAKKYVDSYNNLADGDIAGLVNESGALQKQNTDLRLKYFGIYSQKLNPRAAGHFALIDDYITTAARLALLDQLPLPNAKN
jgi:Spy/CpxP family protein refolding chaperone